MEMFSIGFMAGVILAIIYIGIGDIIIDRIKKSKNKKRKKL